MNETTRASAPGSFIPLTDGITHYELGGPTHGPAVVLVHGFSVPYYIFDPTFDYLTASGFRVLRYDLFGRGWSDRPDVAYDLDLFVRQLNDLVLALDISSPLALVGLSMGGPISAGFTVQFPERVSRQVLIDPAGTHSMDLGWLGPVRIPLFGELVLGILGSAGLVKNIASDFFGPALVEHFQAQYRTQMQFRGFKRAILSTLRSGMLGDFSDIYRQLGYLVTPVLLIWGRQDSTVPFAHSQDLLQLIPRTEFHIVEQAGHIPHYERPTEINPILHQFLSGAKIGSR